MEAINFTERYKSIGFVYRRKDIINLLKQKILKNRKGRSYNEMTPNECGYEYALNELLEEMKNK
jgi:hypothetical protein